MLEVRKDRGVIVSEEGNFFAPTTSPAAKVPYAEYINGEWLRPIDPLDPRDDEVISWEEFINRTSK